jgi:hypothetical protein
MIIYKRLSLTQLFSSINLGLVELYCIVSSFYGGNPMKNVSFKMVCGFSVATLLLSASSQATVGDWYHSALRTVRLETVKTPAKFGSKQWFKNGLQNFSDTRFVKAITDSKCGTTFKAHPILSAVASAAVIATIAASVYMVINHKNKPAKKTA